ncbi:MAG: hypothetical protein WCQ91_07900 [Planctomycetota bacterium]
MRSVFPNELQGDLPIASNRFECEVRAAAKLVRPNIVTAYDVGLHDYVHYLVME